MTQPKSPEVSKETLKAIARLSGIELTDQRLEEIAPQIQQALDSLARLNELNLGDAEPANIFRAKRE